MGAPPSASSQLPFQGGGPYGVPREPSEPSNTSSAFLVRLPPPTLPHPLAQHWLSPSCQGAHWLGGQAWAWGADGRREEEALPSRPPGLGRGLDWTVLTPHP